MWYHYTDDYGGSGGGGGVLSHSISDTTMVTIVSLSGAEGVAYVTAPNNSGMSIRKQRKNNNIAIRVSDIQAGESIVLYNSPDGAATIFIKQIDGTFKYSGGAAVGLGGGNLTPFHFSKYVVSGSGVTSNMSNIRLKSDLSFVGGDGSSFFPFYPEAAGSIGGGNDGGSGPNESFENTETLANSIISVATQVESLLNYQKEKDTTWELENNTTNDKTPPTIERFSLMFGASAVRTNDVEFYLSAFDNISEFESMSVQFKANKQNAWTDLTLLSESTALTPTLGLNIGFNLVSIRIVDEKGNKSESTLGFWKL